MRATDHILTDTDGWNSIIKSILPSQIVVLTDHTTAESCLPVFVDHYLGSSAYHHLSIEPGELSKDISTVSMIYASLLEFGCDRNTLLINLGGGVVTDVGGFVASTYKRGIRSINVPTTHLAMVDAAIGGKNGVNFDGLKNQIGTFHLPQAVLIDPVFLKTLDKRELKSGWMETIKHGLIADREFWTEIKTLEPDQAALSKEIILKSAQIKERIAEEDVEDRGIRQSLNFGHTIGHAIETESDLLHGEAVAIGTLAETFISFRSKALSQDELFEICSYILSIAMSLTFRDIDTEQLLKKMRHDKKNENGRLKFALISQIGRAEVGVEVDQKLILESLDFAREQLNT